MASLLLKGDSYYCQFYYLGRRYTVTVGQVGYDEAEDFAGSVGQLLRRIKQRLIHVPAGVAITDFVVSCGKVTPVEEAAAPPEPTSYAAFREKYLDGHRHGAMEDNSFQTVAMHLRHFERTLGPNFPLRQLTLADLQRHVTTRAKQKYRGRHLSPITLRKEVATFRAAWNWAALNDLVAGSFPSKSLVYPKGDEKLPFMTRAEIERRLTAGMSEADRAALYNCLYLTQAELPQLLEYVKQNAAHPWTYPLFCLVAHTGARRSEALRGLASDVDFEAMTVLVREKKRSRKQRTTRRVPLTPFLAHVLQEWLAVHPGGAALFCQAGEVARSKKRSRTTGHRSQGDRPTSLKGRLATVRRRNLPTAGALTKDEAHDHLKRTLAGSRWEVVKGFHVLRHSFISACASKGVDQRLIDEWTGHSTEEQRRRYRHLYPTTQQAAIQGVFSTSQGG
jgi:integrase